MKKLIDLNRNNIWTGIGDYRRHTSALEVLDDVSDAFVDRLARDNAYAKRDLRNLFSYSNGWNDDLQAIIINGTKTHNPDYFLVHDLADKILSPAKWSFDFEKRDLVDRAICFFSRPNDNNGDYISAINALAPKAYRSNKKPSRIFRALCDALGVTDESKGSAFQRLFAQFADELNGRQLDFKLFVSINPVHFITMSNPKQDERGSMLTSYHSFNVTDYDYNCGCSGYARDEVTFIVFTVDNPDEAELLNNRKTSRQIFTYKPYNGLLLQSRLYNTQGGTNGEQTESAPYRDLVQREISALEDIPNLWKTENYVGNKHHVYLESGYGFGGYPDWTYSSFGAKISIHQNHLDDFQPFDIGTYGLCICCGEEISEKLYCEDCENAGSETCDECGCHCDCTTSVFNAYGERINVCDTCLEEEYLFCCHCEEYYPRDEMTRVDNTYVCPNCVEEYCCECAECGELHHNDNMTRAYNQYGDEVMVCEDCRCNYYEWCQHCDECYHDETMNSVHGNGNSVIRVCDDCRDNHFSQCERCGDFFLNDNVQNGLCYNCQHEEEGK